MQIIGGDPPPPGPAGDDVVMDGTDAGFGADVVEASKTRPVIVDFWAPWCAPCRQLTPALEAAVRAAGGAVKLVKINIDEHPQIAGQLRVQSIPAVYAFADGQPVDGFMGALPATEIDRFVARLSGSGPASEELAQYVARGEASLEAGDIGGAAQDFGAALQINREHPPAIAGMTRCMIASGESDQAKQILDSLPEAIAKDPAVAAVRATLDLASQAGDAAAETSSLAASVAATPEDHPQRFELAKGLAANGDFAAASEHLLAIVAADREWNEGAARAELLKVFEAAGPASPVAKEGRKKLSAILFS